MLNSHTKFHSANGKRLVMVVDDEQVNRELMSFILQDSFEVLCASDGEQALSLALENRDQLSLIMLDLMMPGIHGLDLLTQLKEDMELKDIPVIVMTSEKQAEVDSLQMGAADFVTKPFRPEVIQARVQRVIELSEDRDIIQSTERDALTGLYNREYFYRYAEQFDQHHKDLVMDALVIDVNHFRMINERYGKAYGDEVLRRIGERVREMVRDTGGIVSRLERDTFLVYCPHGKDYKKILEHATVSLDGEGEDDIHQVHLRMGVYPEVDKDIDIERRFDRAKRASDRISGQYAQAISFYDSALHDSEIYAEQLLEDFQTAIREHQFLVYYQPKFDIRPEIPVLASAEALVRWKHPRLGMISPSVFIPLFEDNGLIPQLDHYVWREAAAQVRGWKDRFGISVPVSVNVSRVDMYDPDLIGTFQGILDEYGLSPRDYLLEITESAYTEDFSQIIETVNKLRDLGFMIEMDDFGTGYSSLNMISTLPIDALKLDMKFIRNAFTEGRDTRMIEVIIDIADYLSVPVIAEGVETEEQLTALRALGCDIVQGYYFSKPVPPEEYERFVEERRRQAQAKAAGSLAQAAPVEETSHLSYINLAHALASNFESIYSVDADTGRYVKFSPRGRSEDLQIERSGADFFKDVQEYLKRRVHPDDRLRVSVSMEKDALIAQMLSEDSFTMTYRIMDGDRAVYHNLRTVRGLGKDDRQIVIGISDVDDMVRQTVLRDEPRQRSLALTNIANALSNDFESIYYVDPDSGQYREFTTQGPYEELQIETTGEHFFEECAENLKRVVYPEDQSRVAAALTRKNLMEALKDRQIFSLDYRLVIKGLPVYYRMKATCTEAETGERLVIGISNIAGNLNMDEKFASAQRSSVTYSQIAQALTQDYFTIFYVDMETDHFLEYSSRGTERGLVLNRVGEDFFGVCRRDIPRLVAPEDREKVLAAFTREALYSELACDRTFYTIYRMNRDGEMVHVSLKALKLPDDPTHIVVGVQDIEAQVQREQEFEAAKQESVTYSRIAQALAQDYYSIYYVDTLTDEFIEYSATDQYHMLPVEQDGKDFFETTRRNAARLVCEEDRERAMTVWDKDAILEVLRRDGSFATSYRLMFDGVPVYLGFKVMPMTERDDHHIIVGVSNVDAQMKQEKEFAEARTLAYRDALTGVKNRQAYAQAEQQLNGEIASGEVVPFAVASCDVNRLKTVNDTLGHKAGDQYLKDACMVICHIFEHSPVFRTGGDEFVAILRGADYQRRAELMQKLEEISRNGMTNGGVVVAGGLSDFVPGQDRNVAAVFERADNAMYEKKKELKGQK